MVDRLQRRQSRPFQAAQLPEEISKVTPPAADLMEHLEDTFRMFRAGEHCAATNGSPAPAESIAIAVSMQAGQESVLDYLRELMLRHKEGF